MRDVCDYYKRYHRYGWNRISCGDWHKSREVCIITLSITESITTVIAGMNTIIHTVNAMTNSTIRNTNTKSRKNTTRDIVDTHDDDDDDDDDDD